MSTPPRRLKDDPDFLWETGCDLADEAFVVGGYDLPALKGRVLTGTQPPSGGAPLRPVRTASVAAKVGGLLAVLGFGGAVLVGLWGAPALMGPAQDPALRGPAPSGTPTNTAATTPAVQGVGAADPASRGPAQDPASRGPAPSGTPTPPPTTAPTNTATTTPAAHGTGAAEPASRAGGDSGVTGPGPSGTPAPAAGRSPEVPPVAAGAPSPAGEADAPVEDAGGVASSDAAALAASEREGSGEAEGESTLAIEVELYDAAADHLAAGRADLAVEGYRSYLERFPDGRLVVESRLGLFRAEVARGAGDRVDALAVELLSDPRLSSRRMELVRMRAENLVLMGRCDQAVEVARELPSRDASPIRRACRWKP